MFRPPFGQRNGTPGERRSSGPPAYVRMRREQQEGQATEREPAFSRVHGHLLLKPAKRRADLAGQLAVRNGARGGGAGRRRRRGKRLGAAGAAGALMSRNRPLLFTSFTAVSSLPAWSMRKAPWPSPTIADRPMALGCVVKHHVGPADGQLRHFRQDGGRTQLPAANGLALPDHLDLGDAHALHDRDVSAKRLFDLEPVCHDRQLTSSGLDGALGGRKYGSR